MPVTAIVADKTVGWTEQSSSPRFDSNFTGSARTAGAQSLPLADFSNFAYQGACRLDNSDFGTSGLRNNTGPIAVDVPNNRVFAISHSWERHLGAFTLPTLSTSSDYSALPVAGNEQPFFDQYVLPPVALAPSSVVDTPVALSIVENELVLNVAPYYSGAGTSPETTIVFRNLDDLENGDIRGWQQLDVAEFGSQWVTPIPTEWQTVLGGDYLWGAGNAKLAINGRLCMGMSAFVTNSSTFTGNVASGSTIPTVELMNFAGADNPMHHDKNGLERLNDLWGEYGGPECGFIIPGTRTYCVIGTHGGEKGTQYKLADDNGSVSGGFAPRFIADNHYKYYLFDLNTLIAARDGARRTDSIRPYAYGKFDPPFMSTVDAALDPEGFNPVGGVSWDQSTQTFYMFMRRDNDNVLCAWRYQ